MKKTLHLLGVLLIIVTVFLTGCSNKQAATGLPQDVVNKVSGTAVDNKTTSDPTGTGDKSQAKQEQSAGSQKGESSPQTKEQTNPDQAKLAVSQATVSKSEASNSAKNQSSGSTKQDSASAPAKATVQKSVTMSINCQTAVNKGLDKQEKFKDVVPSNGVILASTTVELKDGETTFDILKSIVRDKKIQMEYEGSKGTPYIQGINNLYEFDGGPLSGWMYCVNKVYPNYGCGEYKLKAGDVIEWNYTCDLGKDLGQYWIK